MDKRLRSNLIKLQFCLENSISLFKEMIEDGDIEEIEDKKEEEKKLLKCPRLAIVSDQIAVIRLLSQRGLRQGCSEEQGEIFKGILKQLDKLTLTLSLDE